MQRCEVFGKSTGHGNTVSHSHKSSKRIWRPNLQVMTLNVNGSELKVLFYFKFIYHFVFIFITDKLIF